MNIEQTTPRARLCRPQRDQIEMQCLSLEQMLPPDHVARVVWEYVTQIDVSPLLAQIRATEDNAGHPATDPRLLVALWLLATIHRVGSARELSRRCEEHLAYRWLCGGVSVNYHTLSDFRTGQVDFLDRLLTTSVATLLHQNLVVLDRVAQDGMRVRASAGGSSFRRRSKLQQCLAEAEARVQTLKSQDDGNAGRQERWAAERRDRIAAALREAEDLGKQRQQQARKSGRKVKEPRTSTTDPEARRMKMPDGGFRPAYNVQLATTTGSGIIVGVDVTNHGSDNGAMTPMVEQFGRRYGEKPKEVLADGGFATVNDIQRLHAEHQVQVFAPVKDEDSKRAVGRDPFAPQRGDPEGVALWRRRMGTEVAKEIYAQRAQTAEWANAGMRNRGLYQFRVRGLVKVLTVVLWHALAHNLLQAAQLRARN